MMNGFTKPSSKVGDGSSPKAKNRQVSGTPSVNNKTNINTDGVESNDLSSTIVGGVVNKDMIVQHVHPIVHSSGELAEPPSPPPSIHPAAHRPSSLTAQSVTSSASGGTYAL